MRVREIGVGLRCQYPQTRWSATRARAVCILRCNEADFFECIEVLAHGHAGHAELVCEVCCPGRALALQVVKDGPLCGCGGCSGHPFYVKKKLA